MNTQEEKTLELVKAVVNGEWLQYSYNTPWVTSDLQKEGKTLELIESIIAYPSKYRIKSKVKTVNYQTRLYKNKWGSVYAWNSLTNVLQSHFEELAYFDKWLEPTQEHTCEYEVK